MKRIALLLCLSLCLFALQSPIPAQATEQGTSIVFRKNQSKRKKIALTFDDGPHPRYTERILDILEKYGVRATFFVIGQNLENYPEVLKAVHQKGHEIGNHSYRHRNESHMDGATVLNEMEKCESLILQQTGVKPRLFRPPQGDYNEEVESIAKQKNYSIILWSIDTRDWDHTSADSILRTVDKEVTDGDIILMHDYVSGKNTTCEALEAMIPILLSRGYEFVTVSELIK